jgi:hypothetical protein
MGYKFVAMEDLLPNLNVLNEVSKENDDMVIDI